MLVYYIQAWRSLSFGRSNFKELLWVFLFSCSQGHWHLPDQQTLTDQEVVTGQQNLLVSVCLFSFVWILEFITVRLQLNLVIA